MAVSSRSPNKVLVRLIFFHFKIQHKNNHLNTSVGHVAEHKETFISPQLEYKIVSFLVIENINTCLMEYSHRVITPNLNELLSMSVLMSGYWVFAFFDAGTWWRILTVPDTCHSIPKHVTSTRSVAMESFSGEFYLILSASALELNCVLHMSNH